MVRSSIEMSNMEVLPKRFRQPMELRAANKQIMSNTMTMSYREGGAVDRVGAAADVAAKVKFVSDKELRDGDAHLKPPQQPHSLTDRLSQLTNNSNRVQLKKSASILDELMSKLRIRGNIDEDEIKREMETGYCRYLHDSQQNQDICSSDLKDVVSKMKEEREGKKSTARTEKGLKRVSIGVVEDLDEDKGGVLGKEEEEVGDGTESVSPFTAVNANATPLQTSQIEVQEPSMPTNHHPFQMKSASSPSPIPGSSEHQNAFPGGPSDLSRSSHLLKDFTSPPGTMAAAAIANDNTMQKESDLVLACVPSESNDDPYKGRILKATKPRNALNGPDGDVAYNGEGGEMSSKFEPKAYDIKSVQTEEKPDILLYIPGKE